jgi:hypothetical protein
MKTDHGAATVAAPCHLGFRLFDLNLWAERRSYPDCAITNVADCSRCRHRGGTVPSGALLCRVKSEFVALDCSFADVDRGDAAAATPCHLEFFHFTGNPRPEAPHSSTGVGEVTTVHGCATVAPPSHLEFYRKPETQVVDAPFGPAQNYLPLCAEDRGFAIATSAEALEASHRDRFVHPVDQHLAIGNLHPRTIRVAVLVVVMRLPPNRAVSELNNGVAGPPSLSAVDE